MSKKQEKQETVEQPQISKEELEGLQKVGEQYLERKEGEAKTIKATKDWLASRRTRTYPILLEVDEDSVVEFMSRRLTEKERVNMNKLSKNIIDPTDVTDEEYELLQKQGYELLSMVIVDPQLEADEWEDVDLALVQKLLEKISVLQYEVNDAKVIDELRNL